MFSSDRNLSEDCLLQLTGLTDKLKVDEERHSLERTVIEDLVQVSTLCQKDVEGHLPVITESFRCVRNACAGCRANQEAVRECGMIQPVAHILAFCGEKVNKAKDGTDNEAWLQCLRCGIQCLGNAVASCPANQTVVWNLLYPKLLLAFLQLGDNKVSAYTCMLIHGCLSSSVVSLLAQSAEGIDISVAILRHLAEHETVWGLYILEKLLASDHSILPIYSHVDDHERLFVLEIIEMKLSSVENKSARLSTDGDESTTVISCATLKDIAADFKSKAHTILGLSRVEDMDTMEPSVVTKQLSILCSLTSSPELCPDVQSDQDLIQCSINLLHSIRMIGQQGENPFSALSKMSEAASVSPQHPVFGLKRDLIRLLANMAYRNPQNQDKIRDAGGIHLIMDHANIDARNPFMMQWAIFAIHNLCENNPANQAVISGLKLEGVADNVQLLKEFGVEAEMEGDKIVVKKLDETKSPFTKDKTRDL